MYQAKDFSLDYDLLISEVAKHPALYDGTIEAYNDRTHRNKEWLEVFRSVVPSWSDLDNMNKATLAKEIQKKWRNIRDSFVKDLKKKALYEASTPKTKWRKYIYHDQLQFLLGCLEKRKTSLTSQDTTGEETTDDYPVDTPPEPPPPKRQCRRDSSRDFESQLIKLLTDHKRQESDRAEDDDRYFLLSMLPSFKNLDEETKLKTRIEMLQVLQRSITACNQSRTEQLSAIFVPKLEFEEPPSPTYESSRALPSSTCNHVDL